MIGAFGLYLDTIRAVKPDLLTVMIAEAFKSAAFVQVAWAMASVTVYIAESESSEHLP